MRLFAVVVLHDVSEYLSYYFEFSLLSKCHLFPIRLAVSASAHMLRQWSPTSTISECFGYWLHYLTHGIGPMACGRPMNYTLLTLRISQLPFSLTFDHWPHWPQSVFWANTSTSSTSSGWIRLTVFPSGPYNTRSPTIRSLWGANWPSRRLINNSTTWGLTFNKLINQDIESRTLGFSIELHRIFFSKRVVKTKFSAN